MTSEEARRILMSDADFSGTGEKAKLTAEALCVAVDALKKQVPMRPVLKLHTNRVPDQQKEWYCPNCDEWITWDWRWKYCAYCGQKIDWNE